MVNTSKLMQMCLEEGCIKLPRNRDGVLGDNLGTDKGSVMAYPYGCPLYVATDYHA